MFLPITFLPLSFELRLGKNMFGKNIVASIDKSSMFNS